LPGEGPYAVFRYGVVRVWQLPPEQLLAGGLGTLPLAPISAVDEDDLPDVIRRMQDRLRHRDARASAGEFWAATRILLGVRYSDEFAGALLRGAAGMKESVTYQAIVQEGRVEEAQRMLLLMGAAILGRADKRAKAAIQAIADVERLEELARRAPKASSWQELLGLPEPRRRNGRRGAGR
jgi:hypothetical protein